MSSKRKATLLLSFLTILPVAGFIHPAFIVSASAQDSCSTSTSSSTFNGTPISTGDYIWFNAGLQYVDPLFPPGYPTSTLTILFTNQLITITPKTGSPITLHPPPAEVIYQPGAVGSSATTFTVGMWVTTVSWDDYWSGSGGEVIAFLSGLSYSIPSSVQLAQSVVQWTGTFGGTLSPVYSPEWIVDVSWEYGAAVYSALSTSYNLLGVKAINAPTNVYPNTDSSGTPENYKSFLIAGAQGDGGSNYGGSPGIISTPCFTILPGTSGVPEFPSVGSLGVLLIAAVTFPLLIVLKKWKFSATTVR